MEIPYYIFLIMYLAGLGMFFLWSFFNVWHIIKFGFFDFTGKLNVFIFVGFCVVVILITMLMLQGTPWFDTFRLDDIFSLQFMSGGTGYDVDSFSDYTDEF